MKVGWCVRIAVSSEWESKREKVLEVGVGGCWKWEASRGTREYVEVW